VGESRQQLGTPERAKAKAARPAKFPAAPSRRSRVLEVALSRFCFPDDEEEPVTWVAQWALRHDRVGTEDSDEDLPQLVSDIVEDARRRADSHDLTIKWDLSGDSPSGKSVKDMVADLGVTLPDRVARRPGLLNRQGYRVKAPRLSWRAVSYGDCFPGGHDGQPDAGQHPRAEEHGHGLLARADHRRLIAPAPRAADSKARFLPEDEPFRAILVL
jgi:hypothetical protein